MQSQEDTSSVGGEIGALTRHVSGDEDGDTVGYEFNLGNGRHVWCGELSKASFAELDPDHRRALGNDFGWFIVLYERDGHQVLGKAVDEWAAQQLVSMIGTALAPPTGRVELGERSNTESSPITAAAARWQATLEAEQAAILDFVVDGKIGDDPSPPAVVDYTERARSMLEQWMREWGGETRPYAGSMMTDLQVRLAAALSAVASEHQAAPIPMVLFCPACGVQHIDKTNWDSPPHRTHQCQGCGHLWRPAAVYTEGVADVPLGTSDVRPAIRERADYREALLARLLEPEILAEFKRARFGIVDDNGNFTELPDGPGFAGHQLNDKARWIGGTQDYEVVRAALAVITEKLNG